VGVGRAVAYASTVLFERRERGRVCGRKEINDMEYFDVRVTGEIIEIVRVKDGLSDPMFTVPIPTFKSFNHAVAFADWICSNMNLNGIGNIGQFLK
jgi:hypothetical protein